jgi:hypothetical protein
MLPSTMMLRSPITLGFAALLAACGSGVTTGPQSGTDVGNGATVTINLHGYTAPAPKGADALNLADGTTVDAIWMVVDRIRLRPGMDCSGGDNQIDVEGPLVANLLGDGVLGGAPSFPATSGPVCRFRTDFSKLDGKDAPSGSPGELVDHSILVQGKTQDGTPFQVLSRLDVTYERDARNGYFDLGSGKNSLFLAFEIEPWIAALDLASLSGSPIEIDDDTNKDRLQSFEAAVQATGAIFRDSNDDGSLSAWETDPEVQLTQ